MRESTSQGDQRSGVLAWIVRHPKSTIAIIAALLLISFTAVFHYAGITRLQRRIDAIRAKGEPVTIEDINATIPTLAPEENKAQVMLEYVRRMARDSAIPEDRAKQLPYLGTAANYPTGTTIPSEQIEAIRWYLSQYPDELAGIHEALLMPRGTFNLHLSTPALRVYAVEWSEYRAIGKIIAIQIVLHAHEGNHEAVVEGLLAQFQLGRVFDSDYPLSVSLLIQLSLDSLAFDGIERTINHDGLDAPSLQRLQDTVAAIDNTGRIRQALIVERVVYLDALNWTLAGNPLLPGPPFQAGAATGVWPYLPGFKKLEGAASLQVLTSLIEAIGEPDRHTLDRCVQVQQHYANMPEYYTYGRVVLGGYIHAVKMWMNHIGRKRALLVAVAVERYRLDRGSWPETQSDLVPDYLSAMPIDPFDGKPIRYAIIPEGICVWTIGQDLKDDGGDVGRLESGNRRKRPTDFGWVILNPELRGRPAEESEQMPDGETSP